MDPMYLADRKTFILLLINTGSKYLVYHTRSLYVPGLCHGDQILCQTAATIRGAPPDRPEWNEVLEFDVPIADLPRSAKLCFVIYQQRQQGRKSKEVDNKFFVIRI